MDGDFDGAFAPRENGEYELVDAIGFHPLDRAVTFRVAVNEIELEPENKLDLRQIYNALAKARNYKPEDLELVISETFNDQPTIKLIGEIREDRKLDRRDKVFFIHAGDMGWNETLGTKHFQHAAMIKNNLPDVIFIRTTQRTTLEINHEVDCLCFHFSAPETGTQEDKPFTSAIDKQPENVGGNQEEEWKGTWEP